MDTELTGEPQVDLNLEILNIARGLSTHATTRLSHVARNVANADTPDYKGTDLQPFSEAYRDAQGPRTQMRATRPGHFGAPAPTLMGEAREIALLGSESPNGNAVSLEDQLRRSSQANQEFNLALGVFRKSVDILRASLSSRR